MSQSEAQQHHHAVAQGRAPVPIQSSNGQLAPALRPLVLDLDHVFAGMQDPHVAPFSGDTPEQLRARKELVAFAREEKRKGREIILATAGTVEPPMISPYYAFADRVFKREGTTPFSGIARARRLRRLFPQGFIYAGANQRDIPVWQASDHIVLVGADSALKRRLHALGRPITVLGEGAGAPIPHPAAQVVPGRIVLVATLCLMIGAASLMLLAR